jgi:hypothetical protein
VSYTIREDLTPQFRQDILNAVNILFERGQVAYGTHYAIEKYNGKWGVAFWRGNRLRPEGGVAFADAIEVIVGAGPLPVIRGVSENGY